MKRGIAQIGVLALLIACSAGDSSGPANTPTQKPRIPEDVFTSARTGQLVVTWKDVSNETGYRIEYRSELDQGWQLLAETNANVTSYTHAPVTHNVQYFYRVAACNSAGCSDWGEGSGKWQSGSPPTLLTLTVNSIGSTSAILSARSRSGGLPVALIFTVRKAGELAPLWTSETIYADPQQSLNFDTEVNGHATVTVLQPATDYVVSVEAWNGAGPSAPIQATAFKTVAPSPPTFSSLRNTLLGNGNWAFALNVHPNGAITEYRFEMVRAGDPFTTPIATESGYAPAGSAGWVAFAQFMTSLAQPGLLYKWRVVAENVAGVSVSDTVQFQRPQ